ncbi:MAG: MFS transporter, partial [Nocardioides sp.]|uniref:MFS transporter n=1 Tax=Nocardioides sp. TaxID=35761 RepID=UPI0039E35C85
MTESAVPAAPALRRTHDQLLLCGICLGYFMVLLDASVLNIALPSISADLGGSATGQEWTISAYLVAFGGLLLSGGGVTDRYGARRVFLLGVGGFAVASALCAAAPSLGLLIGFRVLQGASAALIPSSTLALLAALRPDPAERHRAMGLFALVTGVGFAAGPVLGGVLLAVGDWRLLFVVNLPVAVIAMAVGRVAPPVGRRPARLDLVAQGAMVLAGTLLVFSVIEGSGHPSRLLWSVPATVTALLLVVAAERRSPSPALPAQVLHAPGIAVATALGFGIQVILAGGLFVLGIYLVGVRALSPARAGLVTLPFTLGPLLGPWVGRFGARAGARTSVLLGLVLIAAGMTAAGWTVATGAALPVTMLALLIAAPGLPLTIIPITMMTVAGAPAGYAGVAGGLFNAARQIGGAVGVGALGGVLRAGT